MVRESIPSYPPKSHRMHEVCGPGADFFAFALAAHLKGQVIWVSERRATDRINPAGFAHFIAPENLLAVFAKDLTEVQLVAEEALRSGAVRLVVMEMRKPLDLTAGRRLQLAARDGGSTALAIIPKGMGSNVAETRWQCDPLFDAQSGLSDSTLQHWRLIKNKSGTYGAWHVRWDNEAHRIIMVSPAGE